MVKWIWAVLFCFITSLGLVAIDPQIRDEDKLFQVFEAVGATSTKLVYHHGARAAINPTSLEKQFLVAFPKLTKKISSDHDGYKLTLSGYSHDLYIRIIIIDDLLHNSSNKLYLSMQIESKTGTYDYFWLQTKAKAEKIMLKNGIQPHPHLNIQGRIDSSSYSLRKSVSSAFEILKAKEIEAMNTDHTISISGHSPSFLHDITTNKKKMNIQVASRYDFTNRQLVFTIGTPIITIEY